MDIGYSQKIGDLSIYETVNDLAMRVERPVFLSPSV